MADDAPPVASEPDPQAASPGDEPRGCSTPQVLLGAFILWQIVYLLAANTLNVLSNIRSITGQNEDVGGIVDHASGGVTRSKGHWYDVYRLITRWEAVVNIGQNWRLFSPTVADSTSLVSVELRWDDRAPGAAAAAGARAPVYLRSSNEPDDLTKYVRLGPWRFRRYEQWMASLDFRVEAEETPDQAKARWKKVLTDHVNHQWDTMHAYINWKWVTYQREHEDCPTPAQIILIARTWGIADPTKDFGKLIGPTVMPVARWRPGRAETGTRAAIETYDPQTQQFVPWE